VLVGDSAHATHFSTGLGTTLAIEDAIALADNLGRQASVGKALLPPLACYHLRQFRRRIAPAGRAVIH
jgi:2-polyprenyl-6-methoxyphenol hydroxylase-like FAD-dependent oxidoreductase